MQAANIRMAGTTAALDALKAELADANAGQHCHVATRMLVGCGTSGGCSVQEPTCVWLSLCKALCCRVSVLHGPDVKGETALKGRADGSCGEHGASLHGCDHLQDRHCAHLLLLLCGRLWRECTHPVLQAVFGCLLMLQGCDMPKHCKLA